MPVFTSISTAADLQSMTRALRLRLLFNIQSQLFTFNNYGQPQSARAGTDEQTYSFTAVLPGPATRMSYQREFGIRKALKKLRLCDTASLSVAFFFVGEVAGFNVFYVSAYGVCHYPGQVGISA